MMRVLGEGEPWVGDAALGAAPGSDIAGLARAGVSSPSPSPRGQGLAAPLPGGGSAPPVLRTPFPAPAGPSSFRPDPKPGGEAMTDLASLSADHLAEKVRGAGPYQLCPDAEPFLAELVRRLKTAEDALGDVQADLVRVLDELAERVQERDVLAAIRPNPKP